jgi:hypothetical protein
MPRTTLALEDDAVALARRLAGRKRMTLGQAVSELVRRGARQPLVTVERNGLQVVQLPEGTPRVEADVVEALLEEIP